MKKIAGFTLAEILIAMTILGIVSALTIPYISSNSTKKQHVTTLKQTISMLQGAAGEYKIDDGGFDFSGNRTETNGSTIIGKILEKQLGAQRIRLGSNNTKKIKAGKQWNIYGVIADSYETLPKEEFDGANPIKTEALLTSDAKKINSNNITDTIAITFGHDDNQNKTADNKYYGDTYKLSNGAYIFVASNSKGCNLENLTWNTTDSAYSTPNVTATTNNDANTNLCLALIDVNGPKGPNRITNCSTLEGSGSLTAQTKIISPYSNTTCQITTKEIGDVYPIFFYDSTVAPATNATYALLHDLNGEE